MLKKHFLLSMLSIFVETVIIFFRKLMEKNVQKNNINSFKKKKNLTDLSLLNITVF